MFLRLLALFTVIPIIELALLIEIGRRIGSVETVGLVIVTGLVGAYLAKSEGLAVIRRVQDKLNRGEMPDRELLDGVLILVGGVLLLTPGLITDVVGLLTILPPSRAVLTRWVRQKITRWIRLV